MSLSVIVLAYNEERNLPDCLESLKGLDCEILVVDSGSTDRTPEIARAHGARLIEVPHATGWGEKRQLAQKEATGGWILHLDSDERLTPELQEEIKAVLQTATGHEIFQIARLNHLFGEQIAHCGWYPDYVRRLYRKDFTSFNDAYVHEHVIIPEGGQVRALKHPLLHYTYATVEHCLVKQKNYALAFAEEKLKKGRRVTLWSIPFRGLFSFIRVLVIRQGFKDGRWGLWNAISTATYTVNKYLTLYARQNGKPLRTNEAPGTSEKGR